MRDHLAQVLQAEGLPYDDGALRLLGRAARGSMRDALSLTDQAIVEILDREGIRIARRTVAKYRDQLHVLSARMRKRV